MSDTIFSENGKSIVSLILLENLVENTISEGPSRVFWDGQGSFFGKVKGIGLIF